MNFIGLASCMSDPAILVINIFGDLSTGFWERCLLGGRGILYLPSNFDCVVSLATLDWPAANLLEIAATKIRAAETPRFL